MTHNKKPDESLLKFPCEFAIKVMGKSDSSIEKTVFAIIKEHCPTFSGPCNTRKSRNGNYIALTFMITAESKTQLDKIYLALNECKDVVMAL
ncbi:MAG: hypothetical protein A3F10_01085 [Coxiella sp. RIFCSPHIGHO2_12_FULL_42_15]|nr:MAG: hypothetical protein A3F10_01085 [Coxiella sp. RIFCSPHIGHO2_12_FULL_42_15]